MVLLPKFLGIGNHTTSLITIGNLYHKGNYIYPVSLGNLNLGTANTADVYIGTGGASNIILGSSTTPVRCYNAVR